MLRKRKQRLKYILVGVILTLAVMWSLGPVLWTLSTSLKPLEEVRNAKQRLHEQAREVFGGEAPTGQE